MRQQKPQLRVHFSEGGTISRSSRSGIQEHCIIPSNNTQMAFDYLKPVAKICLQNLLLEV